jgi:hypothetical protein
MRVMLAGKKEVRKMVYIATLYTREDGATFRLSNEDRNNDYWRSCRINSLL